MICSRWWPGGLAAVEPRRRARAYVGGLLAPLAAKKGVDPGRGRR